MQSIQYKIVEDLVAHVHQDFEGYSVDHANEYLHEAPWMYEEKNER